MMGNTDWGVSGRHNTRVLFSEAHRYLMAVPYDFDWAGLIDAPYATPDSQLNLRSVRERRYMGFCRSEEEFARTFATFNERKEAIYVLFKDFSPLDRKYADRSIKYLESFYSVINNPSKVRREILDDCLNMR